MPANAPQQPTKAASRRGFLRTVGVAAAVGAAMALPLRSLFASTKKTPRVNEFPEDSMFRPRQDHLEAMRRGERLPLKKS